MKTMIIAILYRAYAQYFIFSDGYSGKQSTFPYSKSPFLMSKHSTRLAGIEVL